MPFGGLMWQPELYLDISEIDIDAIIQMRFYIRQYFLGKA